jgi:hypothetical protein
MVALMERLRLELDFSDRKNLVGSQLIPDRSGGLNGSTQHFLEVYSQESENLKSLAGVDLSAAPLC